MAGPATVTRGRPDPNRDLLAPDKEGIWKIDMQSGEATLIVAYAQIAAVPFDPDPAEFDGGEELIARGPNSAVGKT